ncbi:MAG: integration host factor subunit beta [Gammaproteobacteria bacterium]|nr:MAG: integration host factor subunit beta [Gammaproteobacteria bacterium]
MTKSELIERLAERQSQLSLKDVELVVKSLLEHMAQSLAQGKRIEIRGFGSFSLHYREPRVGRNPKTGQSVELEGKYVPHFKPGKELRDRVNSSMEEEIKVSGAIAEAGEGRPGITPKQPAVDLDRPMDSMSPPPSSIG